MNEFRRDDEWQKKMRDIYLTPWFGVHSYNGQFVHIDKGRLAGILQKISCDTIVQSRRTKLQPRPQLRNGFPGRVVAENRFPFSGPYATVAPSDENRFPGTGCKGRTD